MVYILSLKGFCEAGTLTTGVKILRTWWVVLNTDTVNLKIKLIAKGKKKTNNCLLPLLLFESLKENQVYIKEMNVKYKVLILNVNECKWM